MYDVIPIQTHLAEMLVLMDTVIYLPHMVTKIIYKQIPDIMNSIIVVQKSKEMQAYTTPFHELMDHDVFTQENNHLDNIIDSFGILKTMQYQKKCDILMKTTKIL